MKLLFDQNLSHKLPARLGDIYPGSVHVGLIGMDRATDEAIWQHAKDRGYAIVTQDADYAERSRLYGSPPKVVWLRCGNSTPQTIERLLRRNEPVLADLSLVPDLHFVEILR